jgi:GNAT superfamily N-acetyltransferase
MIKKVHPYLILEASNNKSLFDEYFKEGKTELLKDFEVNKNTYYTLSNHRLLDCYGIFNEDKLVGFIMASTTESPHYSKLVTTVLSFFIQKEHRKFGAAKELLKCIEKDAKKRGSTALIISSPYEATLGKFITKLGYNPTHTLFGKALNE